MTLEEIDKILERYELDMHALIAIEATVKKVEPKKTLKIIQEIRKGLKLSGDKTN